jgi:hypothetical protein
MVEGDFEAPLPRFVTAESLLLQGNPAKPAN